MTEDQSKCATILESAAHGAIVETRWQREGGVRAHTHTELGELRDPVAAPGQTERVFLSRRQVSTWRSGVRTRLEKMGEADWHQPDLDETRLILLSLNEGCAFCDDPHEPLEVDHIIPLRHAPERAFDATNLQRLCVSCHLWKTTEDRR